MWLNKGLETLGDEAITSRLTRYRFGWRSKHLVLEDLVMSLTSWFDYEKASWSSEKERASEFLGTLSPYIEPLKCHVGKEYNFHIWLLNIDHYFPSWIGKNQMALGDFNKENLPSNKTLQAVDIFFNHEPRQGKRPPASFTLYHLTKNI